MGSMLDTIDCPGCGSEAMIDFYYKTGEEFITCQHCGYNRKFYITNWDEQDKESEFEWVPQFSLEEIHGKGAYQLRGKGAMSTECGSFIEDASEEKFIELVEAQKDLLEHAEYTVYENGEFRNVVLIQGELEKQNKQTYGKSEEYEIEN